ncbi:alpha/beta fold hydrolase [Nocardia sp. NPDC004604]|uniref:alpha/beta hydrolase n=1 Tax=Nocardia sp. NPDC004604 TaxID=3157013 RepID=UPI0033B74EF8
MSTVPAEFYSGGHRLSAVIYTPSDAIDHHGPGVVLCNGMRGVKEWIVPPFAELFAAAGYTALVFDHRGLGASEGVPGQVIPAEQVEDVRDAITFLSTLPTVDPGRVVLWGTSFGGANAISAAAVDERVQAVVTQVPFGDWGRVMRETLPASSYGELVAEFAADRVERVKTGLSQRISSGRILDNDESRKAIARSVREGVGERPELTFTLEAVERSFEYRPERVVDQLAPRPLLIIGSANDGVIPFSECQSLYDHAREPKQLRTLSIGHYDICEPPGSDQAAALALEFLAPIAFPANVG